MARAAAVTSSAASGSASSTSSATIVETVETLPSAATCTSSCTASLVTSGLASQAMTLTATETSDVVPTALAAPFPLAGTADASRSLGDPVGAGPQQQQNVGLGSGAGGADDEAECADDEAESECKSNACDVGEGSVRSIVSPEFPESGLGDSDIDIDNSSSLHRLGRALCGHDDSDSSNDSDSLSHYFGDFGDDDAGEHGGHRGEPDPEPEPEPASSSSQPGSPPPTCKSRSRSRSPRLSRALPVAAPAHGGHHVVPMAVVSDAVDALFDIDQAVNTLMALLPLAGPETSLSIDVQLVLEDVRQLRNRLADHTIYEDLDSD